MNLYKLTALILAALVSLHWFFSDDSVAVVAADGSYAYPGYEIRALQPFELSGRVLSRRDYASGREAELSPVDLAMGWGAMADPAVSNQIDVSQRNRWYFWKADRLPIPRRAIETQSANIHIIAANADVARHIERVDQHDQVRLRGQLVEVVADDGWRWRSSLSREDTGNGSCELLLVHEIEWI